MRLSEDIKIDACVLGGDYLANNEDSPRSSVITATNAIKENMVKVSKVMPVLICRGNHDSNSMGAYNQDFNLENFSKTIYGTGEDSISIDGESYNISEKKIHENAKVVYGDTFKSYGYWDDEKNKMRLIFLNCSDIDMSKFSVFTDTNSYNKYYRFNSQHRWFFGDAQLNWLVHTGLNFPSNKTGWGVVVFCHYGILNDLYVFGYQASEDKDIKKNKLLEDSPLVKAAKEYYYLVNLILIAFDGCGKINKTIKFSELSDFINKSGISNADKTAFDISINVDFKTVNAGKARCWGVIRGHGHESSYGRRYGTVIKGTPSLSGSTFPNTIPWIETSNAGQSGGDNSDGRRYPRKTINKNNVLDVRESTMDIYQFKRVGNDRYIYITRYGAGISRIFKINSTGEITPIDRDFEVTVTNASGTKVRGATIELQFNGGTITGNANPNPSGSENEQFISSTDADGKYKFEHIPKDRFKMTITHPDYSVIGEYQIDDLDITEKEVKLNGLPNSSSNTLEDYEQLSHITSTSGAYIDTGIKLSDATSILRVNTEFRVNALGEQGILGSINYGSNTSGLRVWQDSSDNNTYMMSGSFAKLIIDNATTNEYDELVFKNKFIKLEIGISASSTNISYYINDSGDGGKKANVINCNKNILLCAEYLGDKLETGDCSLKATQIYVNDAYNPVRDYIPVRRLSDNEIGMYDRVNNKFYGSADSAKFTQ